ncbi:MAG: TIGR00645 family protein [Candidatus Parabeggiatoa sp. nov. 1]|nr:MAG: TIGR00645 family protein [Gammaproteobacteria bacterium]
MLLNFLKQLERFIEILLFNSRWLLAPFYIGLIGALVILLIKFMKKFIDLIPLMGSASSTELIFSILGLVDIILIANLLLIIIFSGYENFVSKIDVVNDHVDRPEWMGKVDYSGLKLKVIGSIVAISSIELLKIFILILENDSKLVDGDAFWQTGVFWLVTIHLTFVVSGVLFALTEKIVHSSNSHAPADKEHK